MGYFDFFFQYFRHPLQMGTFTESSKSLVEAVVEEMKGRHIVELGAGRGPVTRGILKRLDELDDCGTLVAVEINSKLYEQLTMINHQRFTPVLDSAENLEMHATNADCIISGLPLTLLGFKNGVREKILSTSAKYPLFIQYCYADVSELLQHYFREVRVEKVPENIPSALVYVCTNKGN